MFLRTVRRTLIVALSMLCGCLPDPKAPPAKPAVSCSKPATSGATTVPPWPAGSIAGGTFYSPKASGPLTIPASGGPSFDLKQDVVIFSEDDLTIDGDLLGPLAKAGQPGINITLVSGAKLTINGVVNGGYTGAAAPSTPPPGTDAYGDAGMNAGTIKLIAGSIHVRWTGYVKGGDGGDGGDATATGVRHVAPQFGLAWGGAADAVSGTGGAGGDIIVCADAVQVGFGGGDLMEAGTGGGQGTATATSVNGHTARARNGNSGTGGDIIFTSGAQLAILSGVKGGRGLTGMPATATVTGAGNGDAEATGGDGGSGGTVRFQNGAVVPQPPAPSAQVIAADGTYGSSAFATAGTPAPDWWGTSGGNATATGGKGGSAGDTPQIPVMMPAGVQLVPGTPGKPGKGGNTSATPGNGGASTTSGFKGGASGTGTATGGANGNGTAPSGGTPSTPAVPATGAAGGIGRTASQ